MSDSIIHPSRATPERVKQAIVGMTDDQAAAVNAKLGGGGTGLPAGDAVLALVGTDGSIARLTTQTEAQKTANLTLLGAARYDDMRNEYRRWIRSAWTVSVSGTGTGGEVGANGMKIIGPNAGVAGYAYARPFGVSQIEQTSLLLRAGQPQNSGFDFSKRIVVAGTSLLNNAAAGTTCWATLGKGEGVRGNPSVRSVGWRKVGTATMELIVHNGTTLTAVTSSVTPANTFFWRIESLGTGVVNLYINGALAATTSAGPTSATTSTTPVYAEEIDSDGTQTVRAEFWASGGGIYHGA